MTWIPGEALTKRVWESIEKLGTGMLSPFQIRREGLAKADVRRIELLNEATAQQDVAEILSGRARLEKGKLVRLEHPPAAAILRLEPTQKQPPNLLEGDKLLLPAASNPEILASPIEIINIAGATRDAQAFQRLLNLRSTVRLVEEETELHRETPPGEEPPPVSSDWLNDWREGAERTSTEEIQRLWAKILVGETKSAGSFSLRTMSFLRSLDQADAKLIEAIAPFVFDNRYVLKSDNEEVAKGLRFDTLLALEDMGIITGASGLGLHFNAALSAGSQSLLKFYKKVGLAAFSAQPLTIQFEIYAVSRIGVELISLGDYSTPPSYISEIAAKIKQSGAKALRIKYATGWDGQIYATESVEI